MKKLSIVSMIGAAALGALALTGCPTSHPDAEYMNSAQKVWIIGSTTEFGEWTLANAFELEATEDDATIFENTFTATTAGAQFKICIDDNTNWDSCYWSGDTTPFYADEEVTCTTIGGMDNCVVSFDVGVEYKITVNASNGAAPVVKFTAVGGVAAPTLQMFFDSVPYDFTYDGDKFSVSVTALETGTSTFLLQDSNGTCWSFENEIPLSTEKTLKSSTKVSKLEVTEELVYTFVVVPTLNGDGDTITGLKLTVTETPYTWKGMVLKGGWEGWWGDSTTLTDSTTITFVTGTITEHESSGNEWGIFPDGKGNEWHVDNLALGTRTEMTYAGTDARSNSTMAEAWVNGKTYTIKLELTDTNYNNPKAFVTITMNEE